MINKYCVIRYKSTTLIVIFFTLSCFLHIFFIFFIMYKVFFYTKTNLFSEKKNYKTITLVPLNYTYSKNILVKKNFSETSKITEYKRDSNLNSYNKTHKVLKNSKISANSNNNTRKSIKNDIFNNKNHTISSDESINLVNEANNKKDFIPEIIRYFHPKYPNTAKLLGIEGEVSVIYNINAMGKIEKIKILPTISSGIFEESIRLAMRQWIYKKNQPQKNLIIVFKFSLNKIQVTTN